MGDVIRKDAAASDIFDDIKHTHQSAIAKGGIWKTIAEEKLGPVILLIDSIDARSKAAEKELAPLKHAIDAIDDRADALLGRISDDIWNLLGRPASDAGLSILYPGGVSYYTDGPDEEQPDRMDLLAELLEAGVHPRLDASKAIDFALEIRACSTEYRQKVDAARVPRARARLLDRITTAVAKAAQIELSQLKRRWKSEGKSESEIHTVIPDRPRSSASKTTPAPVLPSTPKP